MHYLVCNCVTHVSHEAMHVITGNMWLYMFLLALLHPNMSDASLEMYNNVLQDGVAPGNITVHDNHCMAVICVSCSIFCANITIKNSISFLKRHYATKSSSTQLVSWSLA